MRVGPRPSASRLAGGQDGARDVARKAGGQVGQHVGHHFLEHDVERTGARDPRHVDVAALAHTQHLGADVACGRRPGKQGQEQRHTFDADRAHVGGDHDQHGQGRDDDDRIRDRADDGIHPAAHVAGGKAQDDADQHADRGGDQADPERTRRTDQQHGQHVAAVAFGAHRVLPTGRTKAKRIGVRRGSRLGACRLAGRIAGLRVVLSCAKGLPPVSEVFAFGVGVAAAALAASTSACVRISPYPGAHGGGRFSGDEAG